MKKLQDILLESFRKVDDNITSIKGIFWSIDDYSIKKIPVESKLFEIWKRELREHDITCDVVNALDGVPQATFYHPEYDALLHTYYVCRGVLLMARLDLLEAAFLHDYGKGFTTNIGDKRIYHFGHPQESVKFIDSIKDRLKFYDLTRLMTEKHMNFSLEQAWREGFDEDLSDFIRADKYWSKKLFNTESSFFEKKVNKIHEKYVHFKQRNSSKTVYVIVGISGSGKSRFLELNIDPKYIVSPDDLRRQLSGDVSSQVDNEEVWLLTKHLMRAKLIQYGKVYLDATSVVKFLRVRYMSHFNDCRKVAIVFDVDPDVAIRRIEKDIEVGIDRSYLQEHMIRKQYKNFKRGEKSLKYEFSKVIYVKE